MDSMIRRKVQMANQEDSGWAVFFISTFFLIVWTEPARAHIVDGDRVLTDWHWRWDVISVLVIFATLYIRGWLRLRAMGAEAKLSHRGVKRSSGKDYGFIFNL
jgi:hypothetical protein